MNILEKIKNKELNPIGWGTGKMLKHRNSIHEFELLFTISTVKTTDLSHGVRVELPSILDEIDLKKYILIIYSVDFINQAYEYCEKYPELICLPFNSNALGTKEKLENLKNAYETFMHHGVSYQNLRRI